MAKYRKKPVEIEAFQWDGSLNLNKEPAWIVDALRNGVVWFSGKDNKLCIKTLEGILTASPNDYIIQGIHGELYPCKPDIFQETYVKSTTVS